jgi:hypothetical protein
MKITLHSVCRVIAAGGLLGEVDPLEQPFDDGASGFVRGLALQFRSAMSAMCNGRMHESS